MAGEKSWFVLCEMLRGVVCEEEGVAGVVVERRHVLNLDGGVSGHGVLYGRRQLVRKTARGEEG